MTTGPQHYAEAERLLAQAFAQPDTGDSFALPAAPKGPDPVLVAAATAHATLALAAATALGQRETRDDEDSYSTSVLCDDDYQAWWRTASEGPAARQRREEAARAEREEFLQEMLTVVRDAEDSMCSTEEWFRESRAEGCTGTAFDTDTDSILHEDSPPCPVHEPGDVVPAEDRS